MTSTCQYCGKAIMQAGYGRPRQFCGDACKQAAHRAKTPTRRRKEVCTIRTDYLENQIALYSARGEYAAVDVLRNVARRVGAPIDEGRIAASRALYEAQLARWAGDGDTPLRDVSGADALRNGSRSRQAGEVQP